MRRGPDRRDPFAISPSGQRREAVGRLDPGDVVNALNPSRSDTDFATPSATFAEPRLALNLRADDRAKRCGLGRHLQRYLYMSSGVFVSVVCPTSTR